MEREPLTTTLWAQPCNQFFKCLVVCSITAVTITILFNKPPPSVISGPPLQIWTTKIKVCHYFLLLVTPHKNHSCWRLNSNLFSLQQQSHSPTFLCWILMDVARWCIFARSKASLRHSCLLSYCLLTVKMACCPWLCWDCSLWDRLRV